MEDAKFVFDDGEGYERYMGVWSRRVGEKFLRWLSPAPGRKWLDVGCGNGAFTEMIIEQCAPAAVDGIDPAEAQLAFARARPGTSLATYRAGDAMTLPYADATFGIAVMPLVIFFVPDPLKGVAEMARVVTEGGIVTAYAWDLVNGGFPYEAVQAEMEALGIPRRLPPSPDAGQLERLRAYWAAAKLQDIATTVIGVERTFASADELWAVVTRSPNIGPLLAAMTSDRRAELKERIACWAAADPAGRITLRGRAHAIRGVVAREGQALV